MIRLGRDGFLRFHASLDDGSDCKPLRMGDEGVIFDPSSAPDSVAPALRGTLATQTTNTED